MNPLITKLYQSFLENQALTCLKIGMETYSYSDVLAVCNRIRFQIAENKSQNIGIYLTDDLYLYASILAIWFEGKTYVPIHPDFPLSKNQNVIEQAEINTVLSSSIIKEPLEVTVINTTENLESREELPAETDISTNSYILFTSGSTGNPKGVPITFSNLYYFQNSFSATFGEIKKKDKVLQMFELTFDLSVMSYLIPWLHGATVVGLHKKETKFLQILDLLEANEITVALMVPSSLNLIVPYLDPKIKNESLRLNLFCGEALLEKQIEKWKPFVPNAAIYNVYGPTENTIFCTAYKIENPIKHKNGIISFGKTMTHSNLSLSKEENGEGELLLSGKFLAKCYWKNPEKTAETFINIGGEIFYRTGDWCYRDEDGDFFYLNRIDFQAKINGFRIELSEIEYFVNEKLQTGISVAVVTKDKSEHDILTVFVNENISEEMLLKHLKTNLPDYMIPSKIIFLENYPVNTSGKIDRIELKKLC